MSYIGNTSTTQAFTPAIDYFSGNASTTAFTLSRPVASVAQVQVVVNNVAQNPSSAYTISSNTITFTSAPSSGTNNIYVYYTSPITDVIAPGQGTVGTTALVDASVTTAKLASTTGSGAVVLATSPTITTPVISSLSSASATALTLQSAGTTAITVSTSQNVGIGTTTPSYRVDAVGAGSPANGIMRTSSNLTNSTTKYGYYTVGHYTNATVPFGFIQGESNSTENNVHIGGGAGEVTAATRIDFYTAANNTTTNGTERMRIDSSGLVGISKTPNSLAMLEVRAKDASTYQLFLEQNNTEHGWQFYADQADGYLKFYRRDGSGSTKRFEFQSTGAAYSSTGTWGTLSDARLKENIVDATPKLDEVMQLKVRNFNLIGEDLKQIGFVAQELEQVFPNVAETERNYDGTVKEDGLKSVKTTVLIPILVKAIQEQQALITAQAETINALTARIEALEKK